MSNVQDLRLPPTNRTWLLNGLAAMAVILAPGSLALAVSVEEAKAWQEAEIEKTRLRRSTIPSPLPEAGKVDFPGAESLSVRFRMADPGDGAGPPRPEEYASLRRSAEDGDARATRTLGDWMFFCGAVRSLPVSNEPPYSPYPLSMPPTRATEGMSETARRRLEFCAERTPEEIAGALTLFRLAYAGGDVQAAVRIAQLVPGTDEAVRALDAVWKSGSLRSLDKLSKAYRTRAIKSGSLGEHDEVRSLAAYWLYVKLTESAFRQHTVTSEYVEALNKSLANKLDAALPSVRVAAVATARAMLADNRQCCTVP